MIPGSRTGMNSNMPKVQLSFCLGENMSVSHAKIHVIVVSVVRNRKKGIKSNLY